MNYLKKENIDIEGLDFEDFYFNIDMSRDKSNSIDKFENYSSISFVENINKLNTIFDELNEFPTFLEDMSFMFDRCSSIISLPDIYKWNIINVKNLTHLFAGCSSLQYLPDISKWNTENVKDLTKVFA